MNCFSAGAVSGSTAVGGLIGRVNSDSGQVRNSFWDTTTSGQSGSAAGTGKTTAQMKSPSTFTSAGWNFVSIWIQKEQEYPRLRWQLLSSDLNDSGRVDIHDLRLFTPNWLSEEHNSVGDFNGNGIVDYVDFAELSREWLL